MNFRLRMSRSSLTKKETLSVNEIPCLLLTWRIKKLKKKLWPESNLRLRRNNVRKQGPALYWLQVCWGLMGFCFDFTIFVNLGVSSGVSQRFFRHCKMSGYHWSLWYKYLYHPRVSDVCCLLTRFPRFSSSLIFMENTWSLIWKSPDWEPHNFVSSFLQMTHFCPNLFYSVNCVTLRVRCGGFAGPLWRPAPPRLREALVL